MSTHRRPDNTTGPTRIELHDGDMRVAMLSYGATTQGWWFRNAPLILGYDDPAQYRDDPHFLGAIVGRVANRISGASYVQNGIRVQLSPNEGANQLHGGPEGLWSKNWQLSPLSRNTARLTLNSPDGESGFPGGVAFEMVVCLESPQLTYHIKAVPRCPTPISIAQHNYYSLGEVNGVQAPRLKVASSACLAMDANGVPTGKVMQTANGPLDFRTPRAVGQHPVDDFFVFDPARDMSKPIAQITSGGGMRLSAYSDQPGAQIYTGHKLGGDFAPRAGLCIEPSGFPNAVNIPSFPSIMASPENPYEQRLTLKISEGHR